MLNGILALKHFGEHCCRMFLPQLVIDEPKIWLLKELPLMNNTISYMVLIHVILATIPCDLVIDII